ncbi:MAG: CYTH and CHAD domain-containing protein [Pseudomonadota bacterium]|nr:CYTH and CHAD domain-containing protein [Pseudomonadota bacterium]MDP1905378.1 CYTH and CHAD domain-containing protein [Pseudomonadota bacterium]MDP2354166.1 CYTH and CHAD domain-containing protein [Pseudomonadota bacterium]
MEIELKLALDPADVTRCRRHPLLAGVKAERRRLHSIYYDTPDFTLTRRKIALRLRRVGYHWVQTLKAAAPAVGALSARPEWEVQVMSNTPDLAVLPAAARALLKGVDLALLAPVFITDIKRDTWQISVGETVMEIALDQGEIQASRLATPEAKPPESQVCEIELELKAGPPDGLFVAALGLLKRVPLRIDSRSKAVRGYVLAGAVKPAPRKAVWPKLTPSGAAGTAWVALAEAALAQLVDNLSGFLEQADDSEYLHQTRVALRRLLGLARLLRQPDPAWLAPLREHMTLLNPARDWDVFQEETLARLEWPHDEAFSARVAAQAATARQTAQAALASPAFTHAVLLLGQALLSPPDLNLKAGAWAAKVLERRWKSVKRRGAVLADGDDTARHALRIAVKKLRYASDALTNLYGKRGKKAIAGLEALQESLGTLNDLVVAERLMRTLAQAYPETAFSGGQVVGLLSAEARKGTRSDRQITRALAAIKPFWRKP